MRAIEAAILAAPEAHPMIKGDISALLSVVYRSHKSNDESPKVG
jgi:hypothetical protein